MRWKRWFRVGLNLALVRLLLLTTSCTGNAMPVGPRSTLFIGIDVSGSFQKSGRYDDALAFAAYYIHAHLAGAGGLEQPRNLFVGAIGGEHPGQPQAFHPIQDFQGRSPAEIDAALRQWFPADEPLTDFNAFFQRAATETRRRNLVLTPITVVILSDGVPDLGRRVKGDPAAPYRDIDLKPLEYLARHVTVRLLYADPEVAAHWEHDVSRQRVRLWTADNVVMAGWREQLAEATATPTMTAAPDSARFTFPPADSALWRWIKDNVDFRVRARVL